LTHNAFAANSAIEMYCLHISNIVQVLRS